jgi:hypothetical protein
MARARAVKFFQSMAIFQRCLITSGLSNGFKCIETVSL